MKKTSTFQNGMIWFGAGVSIAEILTGTYFASLGFSKGLLANIFNYGTVDIRTASEDSRFEMNVIPEPVEQARAILNIVQEYKNAHQGSQASQAAANAAGNAA